MEDIRTENELKQENSSKKKRQEPDWIRFRSQGKKPRETPGKSIIRKNDYPETKTFQRLNLASRRRVSLDLFLETTRSTGSSGPAKHPFLGF
jgi:hypothetical protein